MDISAIALSGLNQAQSQLEKTARRLAQAADSTDAIDLSAEMVALMQSRNDFATNAQVLKTADEMQKHAVDIMA